LRHTQVLLRMTAIEVPDSEWNSAIEPHLLMRFAVRDKRRSSAIWSRGGILGEGGYYPDSHSASYGKAH
jgi:hypothetical protein